MTIKESSNIPAFLKEVKACRGDVFFKQMKGTA